MKWLVVHLAMALMSLWFGAGSWDRLKRVGDSEAWMVENEVMSVSDPEERFAQARAAKLKIAGAKDVHAARRRAIDLYLKVPGPQTPGPLAAEALFRAGELLRANGQTDRALDVLAEATEVDQPGSFACRAWYESGHLLRRLGRMRAAIDAFAEAAKAPGGELRRRELGGLWRARCLRESDEDHEAEIALRDLVKHITDPCVRLDAYDELIGLLVDEGRVAGAVGYFAAAKASVRDELFQATELGDRVRQAVDEMRALDVLQKAIHDAFDARQPDQ